MMQTPGPELSPVTQLILSLAALLWAVASTVFKVLDRREGKDGRSTGTLTNGAIARLARAEADIAEIRRELHDLPGEIREELAHLLAEQGRRIGRAEEQVDKNAENIDRLRENPRR
jgi:hypothetical protein